MKKIAATLVIISSFLGLIRSLIKLPEQLEYIGGVDYLTIVAWPLGEIAFILLGFALLNEGNSSNTNQIESTLGQEGLNPNDTPSTGLNIICFLIPLVGLIIYLMEKDKAPKKANAAGKAAIWGVGISVLLGVISVIVSLSMINNMY